MINKILVTGTSGFVGSQLIKRLPNHISALNSNGNNIDLRSRDEVLKMKKADTVIHLAGKIPSEKNFSENIFFEHNVLGTLNVLEYCVKKKIKKMIYVSSYVYGNAKNNPINEKEIIKPHNAYTKSKALSEELCKIYGEKFGISIIILRPFNIFGSSLKNDFLIPNILKSIKNNRPITITNKNDKRDYLYIDDFIDVIIQMIDYNCKYEIFNVGSGKCISFENLIKLFEQVSGKKMKIITKSSNSGIKKIEADITKINKKIKWKPKYSLEAGIEKILLKNKLLIHK
jgi:nucleoside-diphosphate-sugar epimerase